MAPRIDNHQVDYYVSNVISPLKYKWNYAGLAKPTKMIDLFGGKYRTTDSYGVMTQVYFKQYLNYWLALREFLTTKLIEKCDILVVKFRLTDVWIIGYLSSDSYCQKYNYLNR